MVDTGNRLLFFSGKECPHCRRIRPIIEEAAKENGFDIQEMEVWHSDENAKLMRSYSDVLTPACGGSLGVPALYNERTRKALCGMRSTKEQIIDWAKG